MATDITYIPLHEISLSGGNRGLVLQKGLSWILSKRVHAVFYLDAMEIDCRVLI